MNSQQASCDHQFISTQKARSVTGLGILGVILFLGGLCLFPVNMMASVIIALAGVLIGMIGRRKTIIVCAKCGEPSPHQP